MAQFNLGLMYSIGNGVIKDYKKAVYWFKHAAKQGYAKAQDRLGVMYAEGHGVNKDNKMAYAWLATAACNCNKESQKFHDRIGKLFSDKEMKAAQALAERYIKKYPTQID
ncbi:MAG: tetratricopeptide repeat protein [Candidatus Arsenophonus phytopathogenicus]